MLLDRQHVEAQLTDLVQKRERLVQEHNRLTIEIHRHDGAITILSTVLAEPEPEHSVSQFPMPVNSTTTTQ
jgi:hypothetical protein